MTWEKFLPARFQAKKKRNQTEITPHKIVADLDAIKAEPVGFYLHDKLFTIEPMDVITFMSMLEEYMGLMDLQKLKEVSPEELVAKYYNCFSKVIPKLTKDDIRNMTQQQCGALYQLVMDTITGQVFSEKKKLYQAVKSPEKKSADS